LLLVVIRIIDKSYRKGRLLMIVCFEAQKVYIYYVYIQYKEVMCKKGVLSYGNLTGILRKSYGKIREGVEF